jgi:hypothetical protein
VKAAIDSDGAALVASNTEGDAIGQLVASAFYLKAKAEAAKLALPGIESRLAQKHADVERLESALDRAVLNYLRGRANAVARAYRESYVELCRLHDQLRGIGTALATANASDDIIMSGVPLVVPNFNLQALGDGREYSRAANTLPWSQMFVPPTWHGRPRVAASATILTPASTTWSASRPN